MVLAQEQTLRSMEQNREPRMDPRMYGQLTFEKAGKTIQWTVSSASGAGKTGQQNAEE